MTADVGHPESRVLASGRDAALLALAVADLPYSILVQLSAIAFPGKKVFSLYSVYREGAMTFDAIVGFEGVDNTVELATTLAAYVRCSEYRTAVLEPLIERVRRHFHPSTARRGIPHVK